MPLISARFAYDPVFADVAQNQIALCNGSEGDSVQLLQQALIDLGYSMPISSATPNGIPDGIFGKETDAVVKSFQSEAGLGVDGIVGPQTLRALDELSAFEDLRPLRSATNNVSAATDRIFLDSEAKKVVGHDQIHTLWSNTTNMKASLLLYEPHSVSPPARLWMANLPSRQDDIGMSATGVGVNPAAILLLLLVALFGVMRPMDNKKKFPGRGHSKSSVKPTPVPFPPATILIPVVRAWELLILAQKIQEIGAAVAWQLVRNQVAKVRACEAAHPTRHAACAEAIKEFNRSQNRLLTQLNQAEECKRTHVSNAARCRER